MYLGGDARGFCGECVHHALLQQGRLTVHAPDNAIPCVQTRHHQPRYACFGNSIVTSVARLEEWACYERYFTKHDVQWSTMKAVVWVRAGSTVLVMSSTVLVRVGKTAPAARRIRTLIPSADPQVLI
jgi:hypothetical protein